MPQIDPKFTFWFGVWTNILLLIAGLGIDHAPAVIAQYAPVVQWVCGVFYKINFAILTALTGLSANKPGPFITLPPSSIAPTIVKILIVAFALSAFLPFVPAQAQGRKLLTPAPRPIICDPANLLPGCRPAPVDASGQVLKNVQSIIAKPLQDLVDFINGDMAGAAALAVAIPNLQDGNGQACWLALAGAGAVFKAHPVPLTFQGVTDLEAIRLLNMTANQVCTNSACTQVFNEATNLIEAGAPMPVPIPSLSTLCSKIPEIAVVAPMTLTLSPGLTTATMPRDSLPTVPPTTTPPATPTPAAK